MDELARIASYCTSHALPWNEEAEARFETYLDLLERFNRAMNLIGPLERDRIVDDLLVDSLSAAAAAPPRGRMLDVGTGAGLPGIPLTILFPEVETTLVEPREKRATFLKIAVKRLALPHVTIENCRIEDVPAARYDYVISKAFQPPPQWVRTAAQWVAPDGLIVCMHATDATAALETSAGELALHLEERTIDDQRTVSVYRPS